AGGCHNLQATPAEIGLHIQRHPLQQHFAVGVEASCVPTRAYRVLIHTPTSETAVAGPIWTGAGNPRVSRSVIVRQQVIAEQCLIDRPGAIDAYLIPGRVY